MKRLTFDGNFCDIAMCQETQGGSFCEDGYCSQRKVWERLKQYEDAEEQGLLVRLPCKAGDTVYKVIGNKVYEMHAVAIPLLITSDTAYLSVTATNYREAAVPLEIGDFGKTVFLTREAAEKALEDA